MFFCLPPHPPPKKTRESQTDIRTWLRAEREVLKERTNKRWAARRAASQVTLFKSLYLQNYASQFHATVNEG